MHVHPWLYFRLNILGMNCFDIFIFLHHHRVILAFDLDHLFIMLELHLFFYFFFEFLKVYFGYRCFLWWLYLVYPGCNGLNNSAIVFNRFGHVIRRSYYQWQSGIWHLCLTTEFLDAIGSQAVVHSWTTYFIFKLGRNFLVISQGHSPCLIYFLLWCLRNGPNWWFIRGYFYYFYGTRNLVIPVNSVSIVSYHINLGHICQLISIISANWDLVLKANIVLYSLQ